MEKYNIPSEVVWYWVDRTWLHKELLNDVGGYWWPQTYSNWLLLIFFSLACSSVLICNCGFYTFGLFEALHIFQVDTSGLPPKPIGLFCMFSCQHILLYFHGRFGALNNVFLALQSRTIDKVIVWWNNVYLSKRPFHQAITHLKRRLYAKVTTPGSWGTNLPIGAHINFGVSSPRVSFWMSMVLTFMNNVKKAFGASF